ncbi:MAG: apolipoprotein N-acyltransferase, partial [Nitrospirae bacterium]|nr:apolipoprotein N-acyltransferase [Nitrospirota bacterium]
NFDFFFFLWIALVPLVITVRGKNSRESFYLGLLTVFAYFAGTVYWVYHSMYYYGQVPLVFSILLLIVLSLILSLYIGIFAMLFNFLSRQSAVPALLTAPVLWVTLEYVRTYALTGFPWSLLGYSQYKFLTLIQVSDITGVYGVSFLVAAFNGAIYDIVSLRYGKDEGAPRSARWPKTLGIASFIIIIIASLFYGAGKLKELDKGKKIRVSVIQGNIKQDVKWDARFQREVIETYKRLSIKALSLHPDIIIWPESAVPFVLGYDDILTEEIYAFPKQLNTHLLFGGVVERQKAQDKPGLSNSAVLLSPEGKVLSVYDKIHLVPFGEYVPLKEFFPFVDKLVTAIGDFVQGEEHTVMGTPFAKIGNLICYEIIFPGLVRQFVNEGSDLLVTITNDAWFGRTAAPYQQFSMAVFRAVENRVPVARAANTGISGFIDTKGRVINKSDLFVEAVLTEEITTGGDKSFYTKYGDVFAWLCIAVSVLLIMGRIILEKRK